MKTPFFCITGIIAVGFIALGNSLAGADTHSVATNILSNLLATKTLVLSSRSEFIIQNEQAQATPNSVDFEHVDILASKMIQQFGFKAQLFRPNHPPTIMQVAANERHATVLIETSEGQPYCLMADHLLVVRDPDNPGGLAYYDGGTVLWGLFQGVDRTNMSFQMTFMATNVPPAAILDLSFIIKGIFAKMTNASYEADSKTIRIETIRSLLEIKLSDANTPDVLGVKGMELQGNTSTFRFSDFRLEPSTIKEIFQFAKRDLQKLNLPLRALNTSELNHLMILIPEGFPNTEPEAKGAKQLQELIKSKMEN